MNRLSTAVLIIVTSDALAPSFERFAAWKSGTGIASEVHTVSAIEAAYPAGRDTPERIRLFLRDAYAAGARWLLLGGDSTQVPVRGARTRFFLERDIPTDLYYACLDGDWNADGDAFFGEGFVSDSDPGDAADLEPELFVGRAPVETVPEVEAFLARTAKYVEGAPGPGDRGVALLAEAIDLVPSEIDLAPNAEEMLLYLRTDPAREIRRFYTNWDGPFVEPGAEPLTKMGVFGAIDKGLDFVLHLGRGSTTLMSFGNDLVDAPSLDALQNGSDVIHLYTIGAQTAVPVAGSIGASWLSAPNGGAVTFLGPTDFGFLIPGVQSAREFVRLVYAEGTGSIGEAAADQMATLRPFAEYDNVTRGTVLTMMLLGDPSLPIRSSLPLDALRTGPGARQIAFPGADPASSEGSKPGAGVLSTGPALTLAGAQPARFEARWTLDPGRSAGAPFAIDLFDVRGRRVRTLERGRLPANAQGVRWNLEDGRGERVPDGVYFAMLTVASGKSVHKLVVAGAAVLPGHAAPIR